MVISIDDPALVRQSVEFEYHFDSGWDINEITYSDLYAITICMKSAL